MTEMNRRLFSGMMLALMTPGLARAQDAATLRIAHDTPIAWLPFYVAYEKKLWQARGINPVVVPSPHGTATLIAVAAGGAIAASLPTCRWPSVHSTRARPRSSPRSTGSRTWSWPP
ncbi:hypothetical protein EZH22_02730 [Xanthobacter dioxanivorans]|uniref:SsuA/THI5-like domain-containing protein n=1 Tax=Xanthobacter dioxanivorans TaxID=2528964 RepID=A0A974PPF6_9HYPH|nr:hypothetical protein [Xanthobacter dioxanivorans]QRG07352.1 hypothetical protein EZH22_02730 [Xanthobacter dioxanivorans]